MLKNIKAVQVEQGKKMLQDAQKMGVNPNTFTPEVLKGMGLTPYLIECVMAGIEFYAFQKSGFNPYSVMGLPEPAEGYQASMFKESMTMALSKLGIMTAPIE